MKIAYSKQLYSSRHVDRFVSSTGKHCLSIKDEVIVVPVFSNQTIGLIREPWFAYERVGVHFPGGEIDDEDVLVCANRELQEEYGYKANRLHVLGVINPFPKYLRLNTHVVVAEDLVLSSLDGDEEYLVEPIIMSIQEVGERIFSGEITDARTIATLLLVRRFLDIDFWKAGLV